jgi:hypothetical protein
MIKASDVNNLLEKWMTIRNKKFEVLDDLSSWREIRPAFKDRLPDLKLSNIPFDFRLIYYPETEKIETWLSADALHHDVFTKGDSEKRYGGVWVGVIDPEHKEAWISDPELEEILSFEKLPKKLASFLHGLTLIHNYDYY